MLNIKPHERTSKPGRSAPTADMTAAAQRVQFALGKAAQLFADLGGTDDLAKMFQPKFSIFDKRDLVRC